MEEQKSSFIISNVGAGEQGLHLYVRIPNTELRTRQTLPDAEKNVSFLLAAWLLEGEREDRLIKMTIITLWPGSVIEEGRESPEVLF